VGEPSPAVAAAANQLTRYPAPAGANLLNCLENEKTDSILYRFSLHRPPPPWK
jgi:hypothetical protein